MCWYTTLSPSDFKRLEFSEASFSLLHQPFFLSISFWLQVKIIMFSLMDLQKLRRTIQIFLPYMNPLCHWHQLPHNPQTVHFHQPFFSSWYLGASLSQEHVSEEPWLLASLPVFGTQAERKGLSMVWLAFWVMKHICQVLSNVILLAINEIIKTILLSNLYLHHLHCITDLCIIDLYCYGPWKS